MMKVFAVDLLKKYEHELIFIILTFSFSWLSWLPLVLNHNLGNNYFALPYAHFIGAFGPLFATICMSFLQKDYNILQKFNFVLPFRSYFWGVLSPFLLAILGYLVYSIIKGQIMSLSGLGENELISSDNFLVIMLVWVLTFGLGEEAGWRGFLLSSLYNRLRPNYAFVVTGIVWMCWHLPFFFYHEPFIRMVAAGMIGWGFSILCGSFFLGWLTKISKWSIVPAVFWHGIFNTFTSSTYSDGVIAGVMSSFVIIFAILIPKFKKKDLEK